MAITRCNTVTNEQGRELTQHGEAAFPVACYDDDLITAPVPWHWHQEWELLVVAEGSCEAAAGQQRIPLQKGEGLFINAGVLHAVWPGEGGGRLHSLVFHPRLVGGSPGSVYWQRYVDPLDGDAARPCVRFAPAPGGGGPAEAIEPGWQAMAFEPRGYEFEVRAALSRVVLQLSAAPGSGAAKGLSARALRTQNRLKQMLEFIAGAYAQPLDTARIARSASISESECLRCFGETLGMPPMRYLRGLRLQKAAALLAQGGLAVAEVGAACGFEDANYFARAFRAEYGCTPTRYRRAAREGQGAKAP